MRTCCICYEKVPCSHPKLPCNHDIHVNCLRKWYQEDHTNDVAHHATCPMCRRHVRIYPSTRRSAYVADLHVSFTELVLHNVEYPSVNGILDIAKFAIDHKCMLIRMFPEIYPVIQMKVEAIRDHIEDFKDELDEDDIEFFLTAQV